MKDRLLVIDEGTTSTRAMVLDCDGRCLAVAQRPLTQYYPAPGLVEHDAEEIWLHTLSCITDVIGESGGPDPIAAIGITNQRETVVFWDRRTGKPLAPAIVWQDRRTATACARLKDAGHETAIQAKTGLLLDPYFSASKIGWALENWPQLREVGGNLAVGTIETYLIFRLTGGLHVSDASNAARTSLMAIGSGGWDEGLCDLFGVPRSALPEIVDCAGQFGHTLSDLFGARLPITGMAGDQQAALIGQACLAPGETKATFGTGAFILTQTGRRLPESRHRLLATVAWQIAGERHYALEGSIFVAGSLIKWLRDDIGLIERAEDSEALARSVEDNGDVYLVPALAGLGAPHWAPGARGAITGLSFSSKRSHIVRAALEAMAHQAGDLKAAFAADGADWAHLRVDGGMVANNWLVQDLADMLDVTVDRPHFIETTAIGAAMLAGLGAGLFPDVNAAAGMCGARTSFSPTIDPAVRDRRRSGWAVALSGVLGAS